MRIFSTILIVFLIPLLLKGCIANPGQNNGGYLNKEQVLKLNPDADFFVYDGKVYKTGVDWIEDEELTKDERIGEISEGMANNLPVGAKIFEPNERKGYFDC